MSEKQDSEEKTKYIQEVEIIQDAPREVVAQRRTSPAGALVAFIAAALFIGLIFGYMGGRVAAAKEYAAPSTFPEMERGYNQGFEPDDPWGGYGRGMSDEQNDSSTNAI